MNRGLLLKSFRETWMATLLFAFGFFAFEAALAYIFPKFQEQFQAQILQMEFIRNMISALLGVFGIGMPLASNSGVIAAIPASMWPLLNN